MQSTILGIRAYRCGTLFLALGLTLALAARVQANPTSTRLVLPGGTPVSFQVVDNISSATANVGDNFAIRVTKDVIVDGWVAIARGADGMGQVTKVERAGPHGHAGSLAIVLDWVRDVDGHQVGLTAQQKSEEGQGAEGKSSTATVLGYVFLGPVGLFAHNFVKGHEMELTPDNTVDHPLVAYVDMGVYVAATTRVNNGFAPTVEAQNPAAAPQQSASYNDSSASSRAIAPAVSTLSVAPAKLQFYQIGVGYEQSFQVHGSPELSGLHETNNCKNIAVVQQDSASSENSVTYLVRAFATGACQVRFADDSGNKQIVNVRVNWAGP